MAKFSVKTYNKIAKIGLDKFGTEYEVSDNVDNPDAIMLRSFDLHNEEINDSVVAVGRAGAGVNNIPINELAEKGVVVFNAPGANANSVKELVISSLLMAARNIPAAIEYTKNLSSENMKEQVESGKKQFAGSEVHGKTIGIIGLGAIGCKVANSATALGMKVIGYDPTLLVESALRLVPETELVESLDELLSRADFISLHIPLVEPTKGLISAEKISLLKPSAILLNFSRDQIVDEVAMVQALEEGKVNQYITDFPNEITLNKKGVTALPHLGASTEEAEDNCAIMVAEQLKDFLENGNIKYSVNFPKATLPRKGKARLTVIHKNEPGIVGQITNLLGEHNINIAELLNKSRNNVAYTIADLDSENVDESIVEKLKENKSILKLRVL